MRYDGEERRERDLEVRIPRWAVALICGFIGQLILWAVTYGQLIQRVSDTGERVERIERKVDSLGH